MVQRLVVGISGASGVILGIRLLETMQESSDWETHLVLSPAGRVTVSQETDLRVSDVEALADHCYDHQDIGAAIASVAAVNPYRRLSKQLLQR